MRDVFIEQSLGQTSGHSHFEYHTSKPVDRQNPHCLWSDSSELTGSVNVKVVSEVSWASNKLRNLLTRTVL
jgi:hypothetical protein